MCQYNLCFFHPWWIGKCPKSRRNYLPIYERNNYIDIFKTAASSLFEWVPVFPLNQFFLLILYFPWYFPCIWRICHWSEQSTTLQGWTKITFPGSVNMRWNNCVICTCCRQENATISPHIHTTCEGYFSPALYVITWASALPTNPFPSPFFCPNNDFDWLQCRLLALIVHALSPPFTKCDSASSAQLTDNFCIVACSKIQHHKVTISPKIRVALSNTQNCQKSSTQRYLEK